MRSSLALAFALLMSAPGVRAEPIDAGAIRVVDGDTIVLRGEGRSVRLVGFDAPERSQPLCAAEARLAETASRRLADLLREGLLDLDIVPCACPPGTEGSRLCNFGRRCGVLRSAGRDVAEILVAEGLAQRLVCSVTHCPRRPRPWCPAETAAPGPSRPPGAPSVPQIH